MDVPEPSEWLNTFGVEPRTEEISGDDCVREVVVSPGEGERLHLTWDEVGDSVRVRWSTTDTLRVDVYREGVRQLRIDDTEPGVTRFRVDYQSDGLSGVILVRIWPAFGLTDALLHAL